jgi:hypothetical protein
MDGLLSIVKYIYDTNWWQYALFATEHAAW